MKIACRISLLSAITILAILTNTHISTVITDRRHCERLLRKDLAKVLEATGKQIDDPQKIGCYNIQGNLPGAPEIYAEFDGKVYRFFAVDKADASIIQLYKDQGMSSDLKYFNNVDGFDIYLWPMANFQRETWKSLSAHNQDDLKMIIVKHLKDMAAKKVYPNAKLPPRIYFDQQNKKIMFINHQELQRGDPTTLQNWVAQLFNVLNKDKPTTTGEQKDQEIYNKLQDELLSFVNEPSTDEKFLDKLLERMETNKKSTLAIRTESDAKNNVQTEDAINVQKENHAEDTAKESRPEKGATKENSQILDSQNLKKFNEVKEEGLYDDNSSLFENKNNDKPGVLPVKKPESKTIKQQGAAGKFNLSPFIIGGLIILSIITLAGAAVVIKRKSALGMGQNPLIA